jgi:glyoxylase-like metal-dependent hydrolase (beta-lactamase superfamily II)
MTATTLHINDRMVIDHLTVGPFQTNVYVVGCLKTRRGAIIDAGGDAPGLLRLIERHDLTLEKILQTHAHIDHVGALAQVKATTQAPIWLHPDDRVLYDGAVQQGLFFGIPIEALPPVDHWLADEQVIELGELRAQVLLLPGHSPGSVAFYFEAQEVIVSGDVLFSGSIGRTDLPGSDPRAMTRSLARLKRLPAATRVLSGHGPATTIGQELRVNPFLR